jgi:hypothetical protein
MTYQGQPIVTTLVERVPDEPIIIITIQGHLDSHVMQGVYYQVAELARNIEGPVYRIIDLRYVEVTLADLVEIVKEAGKGIPGSASDPRIVNIFVGKSHLSRFAADMLRLRRFGSVHCVLMNTLEDALAYVRVKAARSFSSGV